MGKGVRKKRIEPAFLLAVEDLKDKDTCDWCGSRAGGVTH